VGDVCEEADNAALGRGKGSLPSFGGFSSSFEVNIRPQSASKGRDCVFGIQKVVVIVVVLGVALHTETLNTDHRRYLRRSQVPKGLRRLRNKQGGTM
jgi:hypothetical protein